MNRTLILVGAGYSAKTLCSSHYVSQRDPASVLKIDVQAPGHPILKLARYRIDEQTQTVTASLLGLGWAEAQAKHTQGYGCTVIPEDTETLLLPEPIHHSDTRVTHPDNAWKLGPPTDAATNLELESLLNQAMEEPGSRALLVVHRGRIIAERYAAGFAKDMPLIGWSMTKTVVGLLTGILVEEGLLSIDDTQLLPDWERDQRRDITLRHLLNMESGLTFNETYGTVSDVTRMLFLEPDAALFSYRQELEHPPGSNFKYSSGTSNIIMQILRNRIDDQERWAKFPRESLFDPLGMTTAIFETDLVGNYVGSSYLFASARDWARVGQLMLQRGQWQGVELISEAWIEQMIKPAPMSNNNYASQIWLRGEGGDKGFVLPDDAFWLLGHDSQSVAVVPSAELVVVRLGLTPEREFKPQRFVEALLNSNWYQSAPAATGVTPNRKNAATPHRVPSTQTHQTGFDAKH